MLRKCFRIFCKLFELAVLAVIVGIVSFLWRLHQAPIDIDAYIPQLVQFLAHPEQGISISIESARLQWGGLMHPVELVAKNFKASDDGREVLSVPEISSSFSIRALLIGRISPRSVTIYKPFLSLNVNQNGEVSSSLIGGNADAAANAGTGAEKSSFLSLDFLVSALEMEDDISMLSLRDASIFIKDDFHNVSWVVPQANLTYRHTLLRHKIDGDFILKMPQKPLAFSLSAAWGRKSSEMRLTVSLNDLKLDSLRISEKYPVLKNITIPIDVTGVMTLNLKPLRKRDPDVLRQAVKKVEIHVAARAGQVDLPAPIRASYDVASFTMDSVWSDEGDKFDISQFTLNLQSKGTATGNIKISGLGKAFDTGNWKTVKAVFNASASNVLLDNLHAYWPASVAPEEHAWVTSNITAGKAAQSDFELRFEGLENEAGIDCTYVNGQVDVRGAKVQYLIELPPAENVDAVLVFSKQDIKGKISKGRTFDVIVRSGTIDFLNLDKDVSEMVLDLDLDGPARDALRILDYPYLGFISAAGLNPMNGSGTFTGNFFLKMPLGEAFHSSDQIEIAASADVKNAAMKKVFADFDVSKGTAKLLIKDRVLTLDGGAMFYESPVAFSLMHSFDGKSEIETQIELKSALSNKTRGHFEGAQGLLTPPSMDGLLKTQMRYQMRRSGDGVLTLDVNLKNTDINWREIGWEKDSETGGTGYFTLAFKNNAPQNAAFYIFDDNKNRIDGTMLFNKNNTPDTLSVKVNVGRSNISGTASFNASGNVNILMTGKSLDISKLLANNGSDAFDPAKNQGADKTAVNGADDRKTRLSASAKVDKVWLSAHGYANDTDIFVLWNGKNFEEMRLNSLIKDSIPMNFQMVPSLKDGIYKFTLYSPDAGETLRALDYVSAVRGGEITVKGEYDEIENTSKGIVHITAFRVSELPVFTKILSLSGIIDAVKGDGVLFDKSDIPFTLNGEKLTLTDGLVSGPSLGVTVSGNYFRDTGYLNFKGSLVPFYTLNSFLGKIPLIGRLFSGESGGGLIAPTYTVRGKLPSPEISVNVLSALAPGMVRSLVEYFTSNEDLSKKEQPQTAAPSAPVSLPVNIDGKPKPLKELKTQSLNKKSPATAAEKGKELTETLEKQ